jgi:hypothetical protein
MCALHKIHCDYTTRTSVLGRWRRFLNTYPCLVKFVYLVHYEVYGVLDVVTMRSDVSKIINIDFDTSALMQDW